MRAFRIISVCVSGLAITAVAACGSSPPPPPANATGVTNAQQVEPRSAAWQVASERCKHAEACGDIGGSRDYASTEACLAKNRGDAENDLRSADCPKGVNSLRLQACLSEIASEACSGVGSGWERMMSCKTGSLCP
jgi:uncharacterized protein DUF6184